ncbi:bifunctional DNA-formamidopyrimidine glycosylase/DNA-(apurinic or apyrimidinic site) lyase [Tautonia sociabilis]|uniref:Formamidopyrimidine-DNA glycosylase n=1 Tax=Tautonia sociabilis TaxID=2080755 RepID=A0A432MGQ6_9BACT|nr:bifunctional DNA-formamidopyrimidine glycosylase/DNA-(apurinic or apyrimidinic site) lyase [Tautonia sociabilis]RUL85954.1 bifunctional DNA-formamidopyrimidine glycosylase/DNA-(apurinic or apyrimidinic site) lyase [Tautonia sociabilis]
MPELPEVETMVRGLRPALAGRTIQALEVADPLLLDNCDAPTLERSARQAPVSAVNRRGKWVVIELAPPRGIIVIQPRMTGAFFLVDSELARHIRLTLTMQGPGPFARIRYNDPRRLGRICWYPDASAAEAAFARSHGPDALEISSGELAVRLSKTTRPIKPTLLDQKVLAGIGNIYADEILHRAGVHPERSSLALSRAEVDRIHQAIGEVLTAAISAEGSSLDRSYRTVLGTEGSFLELIRVYGRGGRPCLACQTPITRARIAGLTGRSTHYCPSCQPAGPEASPPAQATR